MKTLLVKRSFKGQNGMNYEGETLTVNDELAKEYLTKCPNLVEEIILEPFVGVNIKEFEGNLNLQNEPLSVQLNSDEVQKVIIETKEDKVPNKTPRPRVKKEKNEC